jgi:hypothetical protein
LKRGVICESKFCVGEGFCVGSRDVDDGAHKGFISDVEQLERALRFVGVCADGLRDSSGWGSREDQDQGRQHGQSGGNAPG